MFKLRLFPALTMALLLGVPARAGETVPFKAAWEGVTVAADLSAFPIVKVVASGGGQGTALGRYVMTSPHFSNVFTGEVWGEQIFTAANGDTITATFSGVLTPIGGGALEGTLPATIVGGTGRFEGATGEYDFHIVAVPLPDGTGFASTAEIDGVISSVGSLAR